MVCIRECARDIHIRMISMFILSFASHVHAVLTFSFAQPCDKHVSMIRRSQMSCQLDQVSAIKAYLEPVVLTFHFSSFHCFFSLAAIALSLTGRGDFMSDISHCPALKWQSLAHSHGRQDSDHTVVTNVVISGDCRIRVWQASSLLLRR